MDTRITSALAFALLFGCGSPPAGSDAGPADGGGGFTLRSPPTPTRGACDGVAAYEERASPDPALDWSALHAQVRFFGDHTDPFLVDAHLVDALGGADAEPGQVDGSDEAFGAYAEAIEGGCFVGAWPLPEVPSSSHPEVRWWAPGQQTALGDATHLVVDLRAAPEGPALDALLETVLAEAVSGSVELLPFVRAFNGMRDEFWAPTFSGGENLYRSRVEAQSLLFEGRGSGITLAFLLGDRVAPSAARLVIALRMAGRAAILGHGLHTRVAEYASRGAGTGGVHFTAMTLHQADFEPLPARLPADDALESAQDAAAVEDAFLALSVDELPRLPSGEERALLEPHPPRTTIVATERHEGSRQAALIALHGATEIFFPYWDVVDTDRDARLRAALALEQAEGETATLFGYRSIRYWSHALADSHAFTYFAGDPPGPSPDPVGTLPVAFDATASGEPVVRQSEHPDFNVGDVVVASRGVPAADLMAQYLEQTASSASSAERNGLRAFTGVLLERDYLLRDVSGEERTVTIDATDLERVGPSFETRPHGPLTDLGHPELFYANLSAAAVEGQSEAIREGIDAASGVVLDMRGYPGPESWTVIGHLLYDGSPGPIIREVNQSVLGALPVDIPQPTGPRANGYRGEVRVLAAPTTQSQAEHLILTLQAADRVGVVGRPSAGANGNITAIALPGNFAQSFTGMVILQPDESPFHGVGVRVDSPVEIVASELAAGIDPELARAIEELSE